MNIKKIILLFFIYIITALPAGADVIWPSLYIVKGMLSLKVIILGLIAELLFVKYFTKTNWKQASIVTVLMNLITTFLGIFLIPISGLGSEIVFDFVFHAYDKFGIGTFHWSHWLVSYVIVILINTFIEGMFIRLYLKLKFNQIFWWLTLANATSVFLCFIYLIMNMGKLE